MFTISQIHDYIIAIVILLLLVIIPTKNENKASPVMPQIIQKQKYDEQPAPKPIPQQKRVVVSREIDVKPNADIILLAKIIYIEARGESFNGKIAVGATVINRVKSDRFPKTISEVILQPGQYASKGINNIKFDEECYKAALEAFNGVDPTNGALYFWNPSKVKVRRTIIARIGGHVFSR